MRRRRANLAPGLVALLTAIFMNGSAHSQTSPAPAGTDRVTAPPVGGGGGATDSVRDSTSGRDTIGTAPRKPGKKQKPKRRPHKPHPARPDSTTTR